jgi:glycosyltransferase involved in cell wall biosynthesis
MSARVTVITTTYNRPKALKRAIKSVLAQSLEDFEHIIVDDCSTEGNVEQLVASFADPRLRYVRTDSNCGHDGRPKNLGISLAQGELVCFLDDDDAYRADALKILSRYAEESKADVVYGDYLIDGKPGWSIDFSAARLAQHNYISMVVAATRRETLLAVGGFDEDVPKFKDWNLWLRIQKWGGRFLHVPIPVADVSVSEGSVSARFGNEKDEAGRYKPTYFNPADCRIYPDRTMLGERRPLRVAVYTLTMNRLEYTKVMASAIDQRAGYAFDWYVIDQGSIDGTKEWLKSLHRDRAPYAGDPKDRKLWREKLRYRLYDENVGLAKGWNNIVEFVRSEGDYDVIVKVDNDAEVLSPGWLAAMVEIFERNRNVILSPYVEGLDGAPGGVLRQRASGESPYVMINDRVLGSVPNLGGIVFATPISLWKDWKFDESYEGNKDYLLSLHARSIGYSLFYMEEFRVWHIDGTKGQHAKYPDYFAGRPDVNPQ